MKRGLVTGCAVLAILFCASTAFAGGSLYSLSLSGGGLYGTGDTVTLISNLDSSLGADVQGWSYGICHDPAFMTLDTVALGADAATVNQGGAPDFAELAIFPEGATAGVVICFTGCAVLMPTAAAAILETGYTVDATSGSSDINYCDTLGVPPVSTVVVVNGQSLAPSQSGATVTVPNPNELVANDGAGLLGGTLDTTIDYAGVNNPGIDAVQLALTYDSAIVGVNSVANTIAADFFDVQPGAVGELVIGIVVDTTDPIDTTIPGDMTSTLATVTWDALAVGTSPVAFADGIGSPAVNNAIFSGQTTLEQPTLVNGTITVVNFNPFVRSDCNNDGHVDIADGIFGLNFLFQGGPDPTCDDACDSNDDALIDAADCIYIFNYRFLEGPAPLAPFPTADLDPTPGDGLGCNGDADDI